MDFVAVMKPKVFIASPLFNPQQIEIIRQIEEALDRNGFEFYSARLHSGSDKMTPEQRKDINAWDPVYESNERGLNECNIMIAVMEYAMPENQGLYLRKSVHTGCDAFDGSPTYDHNHTRMELPDAGTVFEVGYYRAQWKPVVGFHTDKAKHLNLMLTHGMDGFLRGFDSLNKFVKSGVNPGFGLPDMSRSHQFPGRFQHKLAQMMQMETIAKGNCCKSLETICHSCYFDWTAVEPWDASAKDVE